MKKEVNKPCNIILFKSIISLFFISCFFSCNSKKQNESVELYVTNFTIEVPNLFFRGAPLEKEKLNIIYNVRVINKDNKSIDFNDFIYERNGNTYNRLNPIDLQYSFDSLSYNDTIYIRYMSNTSIDVLFNLDSLKIYEQKGVELAESRTLFYKNKNNYVKVPVSNSHSYFLYTIDKNGKWYSPIVIDAQDIFN